MSSTATIKIPANTLRPASRVQHVRATYAEHVAEYLLGSTWLKADLSTPMGRHWELTLTELTDAGYMRRTQTGAHVWQRHVARVQPAGPGRVTWYVYDSVKDDMPLVRSGSVHLPADADQAEIEAAYAEARKDARAALTELNR